MTILHLYQQLNNLNISPENYYIQGLYGSTDDNDKPALIIRKGKYTIEYEYYYKERGQKHSVQIFTNETEACEYFLEKFKK